MIIKISWLFPAAFIFGYMYDNGRLDIGVGAVNISMVFARGDN